MSLTTLPTELIIEIVSFGLDDMDTLLRLVSTCRHLCLALWPLYTARRSLILQEYWARFQKLLKGPHPTVKLAVDEDEDSDEYDSDSDEYDDDDDIDSEVYHPPDEQYTKERPEADTTPYSSTADPFSVAYARVTIYLDTADDETRKLLRFFVRRVPSIDSLTLDFGRAADIRDLVALITVSAQIPDLDLTIRGGRLTGHDDWQSGPFNPLPAVPEGDTKNPEDYAYALRRPRTVHLALSCAPQRISSLTIEADAMFIASMYPITLHLLTLAPLTSLALHRLYLDAFNWSQILPALTLPHLADLALTGLELASHDLVPFLARHAGTLTALDLARTPAIAMTLRLLRPTAFDLPHLATLRADPSYLIPLLQHHLLGRLQALRAVALALPARMALVLRAMPADLPPELDDLAFRDLDDFYAVYASLARCSRLTTLELEDLRHNGFVEWVLASTSTGTSTPTCFPRTVQEIVMTDGDLLIRRGTVLPLAQWMRLHCPAWQAAAAGRAVVSKYSLPTDPAVEEMVRTFFSVVFPGMVSLQYKMGP
ncbi:hypothetical protein D9619_012104 [Psilocybe cf. subviscida]|uniref:Uncharacterized protein n=1 Tax=Psilocybe cf. subviscida TaxID=2480587 RepID=A0A8H5B7L2_9AGAR|nr:hypothetical protein D9619_012104 [Psilocybe cf. subviscida]